MKLLIANRGEVAVRIVRACRELGVRAIAVYSDADAGALHTRLADEAHRLGPAPARESYLDIDKIVAVARESGADAVHPGYGLLSENAEFAQAVIDAGLIFVGPQPGTIAQMGDKVAARDAARRSGVPLLPGSSGTIKDASSAMDIAEKIGYPLVVKACFGGGGRGMRIVRGPDELATALQSAGREANAAFGRAEVYLERYIASARHVEVQVLADAHGNVVHLGDRDCSVQRRHQKLIEEAPAPALPESLRQAVAMSAIRLTKDVSYRSAGTVEFLVDVAAERFYFLEMNTRLQVEHGVTELVTGIDIVAEQIRIARGEPLRFSQEDVEIHGHAMQARIAAEDPWEGFQPRPGRIDAMSLPQGPWLRLDFGVEAGDTVVGHYDSMFGKVQAWGPDRETARIRLSAALGALNVSGVMTTAPYLRQVLGQPEFIAVTHDTGSAERSWRPEEATRPETPNSAASVGTSNERRVRLSTTQGAIEIAVFGPRREQRTVQAASGTARVTDQKKSETEPVAPIAGAVVAVCVKAGEAVAKGAVLVVLEAMKMELPVVAPRAGIVEAVLVVAGDVTARGSLLVRLSSGES
ncbi:acetyl/propionyl/methylcrotonyl-CoA carboxylase subunit alpha [Peristeroidobacter soli]|uniref:acetyl/propionyl/methylcrotonyl-CoA carboxylase subunit alpha n=1 Tax=Peristeroidobacter soli TaxID=2497877 RepID=UPI001C37BFFE|nr:acetyl-CoA carboxylase biotin carboxylase subunit [Peristeroidobacter soli]